MDIFLFILHMDTLHDRGILKFHKIFTKIVMLAQNWSTFYVITDIYITVTEFYLKLHRVECHGYSVIIIETRKSSCVNARGIPPTM